ncbi:DUF488 domain-containing protein [Brevibacterium linens ATCC 9172]|uniref:DUF488 domain-containing protein n=1 Tax=Brevibacterium linens ATCC 9172 TaxID=1255617 RepID=A0A2H1J960_BRELN|nr:DUF488 domain-containing protein [Brevibacterium linens ATCC 9172]SMX84020.1 Protein of unknown function, DUF488 [Brevibacterium linens ATCC 9172]
MELGSGQEVTVEPKAAQFLTIGHSNRSLNEFTELLDEAGAEVVVDVRKLPGSNRNPQFNADALATELFEAGIDLRRLENLTGRRPVSRTVPFEVNGWWQNRSFHNYADHCLSPGFHTDVETLIGWGESARCVLMCSEAVWWRCHRRIIADHLLARGLEVAHVLGPGHIDEARLSAGAVVDEDARVTYPSSG